MGLVRLVKRPPAPESPHAYLVAFHELARSLERVVQHALPLLRERVAPATIALRFGPGIESHDDAHDAWYTFRRRLEHAWTETIEEAGQQEFRRLPRVGRRFRVHGGIVAKAASGLDVPANPYSIAWIRRRGGDKIRQASDQQKELVKRIVGEGYAAGARPEQVADRLARVIGLTDRQATAVESRRQQALDETADEDFANGVADDYASKQLAYRADMIARTENSQAREQGRKDSWAVARDEGDLPTTAMRRWISFPAGPRLCDECADMNGELATLDEPFVTEDGEEVEPGDIHPDCRCTQGLEV